MGAWGTEFCASAEPASRLPSLRCDCPDPSQMSGRRKTIRRGTINGEPSMDPLFTTQYEIRTRNPDTLFAVKRYDRITGVDKVSA